ncbi:hypothetical protein N7510_000636 [Penicillium lagena]|uniref:uncharacterized protein n=1 Tax=Penicillium lagena TaxID=94218 RepID=UPI00254067BD|nr:uncharacterized protein N7510_000636 [Penicillium lagena]KAJ5624327.1 hypothetical protein N7510_000636 [Penicillium lagena]
MATSSLNPKIVVLEVPTEAGTHWPGQSKAPEALKDAGLVQKLQKIGYEVLNFNALDEVEHWLPTDILNGVRNEENTIKVMRKVAAAVSSVNSSHEFLLVLGGDCSIEGGVLSGLNTVHLHDRIGLLYFDGDADLTLPTDDGIEGMTGILDSMVITHLTHRDGGLESMKSFSKPDGSPLVTNENIVLFGLDPNQPSAEHWTFLVEGGFKVFSRPTVSKNPTKAAVEALTWLESRVDKIVVHFDLDVIDTGQFPIGNYPHYAGLEFDEAMTALRVFAGSEKVMGLVVTEVNANNDPSGKMLEMLVDGIVNAFSKRLAVSMTLSFCTYSAHPLYL